MSDESATTLVLREAVPPSSAEVISGGRARIDEVDAQIIDLVRARIEASKAVQAARISAGGTRVQHSREIDILNRYRRSLGAQGSSLALLLLEMARGQEKTR
jgi:chorismate mutase